uniref:Uncharacterized protein n=1 Tax=Pyxicephalus adspersus TaxID=30357 RepID=A0AAV3A483_PYXAD|nr:TPA: hypothetical protein GDO54_010160 [Pyxicephalus adspersus]
MSIPCIHIWVKAGELTCLVSLNVGGKSGKITVECLLLLYNPVCKPHICLIQLITEWAVRTGHAFPVRMCNEMFHMQFFVFF